MGLAKPSVRLGPVMELVDGLLSESAKALPLLRQALKAIE
jgi:hypothetical protein